VCAPTIALGFASLERPQCHRSPLCDKRGPGRSWQRRCRL